MHDILRSIVDRIRRDEADTWERFEPAREAAPQRPPLDVLPLLAARRERGEVFLITEIKKASPSKGIIRHDFNPAALARAYEAGGASALSVLTERHRFQGDKEHLRAVRAATGLPLLRKDFIVHPAQVYEARALGADLILLIAACLDDRQLDELYRLARMLGLTPLIEVHDRTELERTLRLDPPLIGINNRDLRSFAVDLQVSFELKKLIPASTFVISESGITTPEDIHRLLDRGFAGALVGEALMREADVTAATRRLRGLPGAE